MWIISNMEDCIVNTDHVADIYCIGTDVVALIANAASKSTVVLGRYNGSDQSRCALNYLFRNLQEPWKCNKNVTNAIDRGNESSG